MRQFITVLVDQPDPHNPCYHEYLRTGGEFSDFDHAVEWCKDQNDGRWPAWGVFTLLEDGRIIGTSGKEIQLNHSTSINMHDSLVALYQQLKDRYGVMSKTWDDFHTNEYNQRIWFTDDGRSLKSSYLEEFKIWDSLCPLFVEFKVPYAQDINIFLARYTPIYRKMFIETNGEV